MEENEVECYRLEGSPLLDDRRDGNANCFCAQTAKINSERQSVRREKDRNRKRQ